MVCYVALVYIYRYVSVYVTLLWWFSWFNLVFDLFIFVDVVIGLLH